MMKPDDIFKLFGKVGPYLKQVLKELRSYESRVKELAKDVNKLQRERKKVQNKVRVEEKRHGRTIDNVVVEWLKDVDRVMCLYENFLKDEESKYAVFSEGYLPKPAIRYRLSVILIDITKRVNVLLQTAKFDIFSYWLGPPSFDADFDNIRYENFESRNQTRADIMAALANSNVGLIGVYGLSGVGKTSLIKEIAKEVKGNMFDEVIMVNVTSSPEIRSIQGQIADKLGMKLEEESESGRAARLRERLKNPKEKTLIILDNMVVKLDFNILGIPSANTVSSQTNHKTLMISSSEQLLLSHQTDGKRIQTICVEPLTKEEAEWLFKTMAEIGDEHSDFGSLAAQIANKCRGLPMTIVTTATALKNKSLPVWQDACRKLESQNLTGMPEFSTKLSYKLLEDEELKHTFLICARMNDNALITDLVRYCIGLGLLQGIYTVREATYRVHALVAKLKELSLLSDSFSSDRFTMQDVVREAALSIASQQMHAFALTKVKLDEWPGIDKLERYTAISLHHCDLTNIMKEFPESINCSRLRVFHLDNKGPVLEIPDNFFGGMQELRVLKLIGLHLSSLPSSIKCLKKLRMLCLEQCKLGDLSAIGELDKLRVLSLSGSDFDKLSVELRQLAKLQILDISDCFKLVSIPSGVLSSLTSLEELYVGSSPIIWKGQGNASLSELRQLNQLTTLDVQIPKITHFPENLFFDKLDIYKIVIREFNEYPEWEFKVLEMCEASRYLALQPENGFDIHHWKGIKILFERVENLLLGQLNDVDDIFYDLNYEGFPCLKYLSIVSNSKVRSIINSENQKHPEKAFPNLESLFLYEVNNMKHIFKSTFTRDSFCKLKIIKLKMCGQLENIFFSSMIKHLSALETMEVSECKSLKEIVTMDRSTDEIKFPELRSLTLHSLSEFIGFYDDDASTGDQVLNRNPGELFDEKVVISKLERMELSSIKIQKIWNIGQSLTRPYFQNLIHLDVNDCWNLRYLVSLSMAKIMMNLQSLLVSQCGMMESIFETEVSMTQIEVNVLSSMSVMAHIEVGMDKIRDKEKDPQIYRLNHGSIFPKLKNINLSNMKRLKEIWTNFIGYSFGKLDTLIIEGCNKLENVFPSYMVGKFQSVSNLKVTNCRSMTEIFDLKGCEKRNAEDLTNLQNVHIKALPKLENVWNEDPEGILSFKNLEKILVQQCLNLVNIFPVSIAKRLEKLEFLEVRNCGQLKEIVARVEDNNLSSFSFNFPKLTTARFLELPNLENFYEGTHELCCSTLDDLTLEHCHKFKLFITEIKSVFSPDEVIYNLKSMQIEQHDAYSLKGYMGNYRMRKLEEFHLSGLQSTDILDFFLHRNPNLKSLLLSNCLVKQLVPPKKHAERSGAVPKLKSLKLANLPSLEKIGFEEYRVLFRMLECLTLEECPCLNAIAPSSQSFTYLTNLEVKNCNKLSHLMTASTAKSLVQLTTMKVNQCESMVIIVLEPENEERINFRQLKEIELVALQELQSFSSSNHLDFPSLEKFVVLACDKMKTFTFPEQEVISTPVLKQVRVRYGEKEERCYWKGDLNFTIQHMHKTWALDKDHMSASHPLEALQSSLLKTFVLTDYEHGALAIPTNLFTGLKNLEELEISSSTNVQVIFEDLGTEMKGYTFPLKKLTLRDLPNLKHVWDKDRQGILSFQNLQEVCVADCHSLKTLFPVELAKKVERLHKLEIRKCEGFVQIVQEENDTTEEDFSFPRLNTLNLLMLPQLSCFYPGKFTLECPDLDHLEVLFCGNFETFESPQEAQSSTPFYRQPLFSQTQANFILESLKLDSKNTTMLCNGMFPEDMLHKLLELELNFDDVNKVSKFPIVLLEKAFNLEYLEIRLCRGLEELFSSQPQQGEVEMPGHVTTSVHSALSFSNLRKLSIKECHGLRYLFTSSTARKLVNLEVMHVKLCGSMQEIVAKDHEEITSEAIKFEHLNTIILDSLPRLTCFCSGSDTLHLPSLIEVHVLQCPKLKIFSHEVSAESFRGIQLSSNPNEDLFFHQDLNATVQRIFEREFFEALDKTCSSSFDETILRGNVRQQNRWLRNLVTLKLIKFNRPYAIPYVLLPLLNKLEELEVGYSDEVEVIFYMSDTEILKTASQLKVLTLIGLPKLRNVWEMNSQEVLIFSLLQEVVVSGCENLQSIFPTSVAKNLKKLEKLEIGCCDKLLTIVEKEEGTLADATKEFVFPYLEKLELRDLPQLTCFYPEAFTLECPTINQLGVLFCHELQLFPSIHPSEEGEGMGTSINRLPLISDLKVISNMKVLMLDWKHISALTLWFRSEKFMEVLEHLNELSLSFLDLDQNPKPVLPFEILHRTPNLESLNFWYCNSPEIFLSQNPKIGFDGILDQLKILGLGNIGTLHSIESEDKSLFNTICEKLHELNVCNCPHLTTLVHSMSFSCLKKVYMYDFPNLQYLFIFSAVKNLNNLEEIIVVECESVKEIVAKEGDATSGAFKFERLHTIALVSLPSLICFYSGSGTLHLPSLIDMRIRECPNMEIFSQGVIDAESFQGIQISVDPNEDLLFHNDLNATVKGMFQPQMSMDPK